MTNAIPSPMAVLADPTRRQVFEGVIATPRPVSALAQDLPVSRSAVSQHLKVLSDAGLVQAHRQGRQNIYRVCPEKLAEMRAYFDDLWQRALVSFAAEAEAEYERSQKVAGQNMKDQKHA